MAIDSTQSTAQILAKQATSNRLREQQALLNTPDTTASFAGDRSQVVSPDAGVNLNAGRGIQLFSQGLSGAANALTAGDRRAAQQLNLERENALLQEQRNQANTLFGQGQEDRRAEIAGQHGQIVAQETGAGINKQLGIAKGTAIKDTISRANAQGIDLNSSEAVRRAEDMNEYYATGAAEGGRLGAVDRFLQSPSGKGVDDLDSIKDLKDDVIAAREAITSLDKFKGVSPALLDFAIYDALQNNITVSDGFFGINKGDISAAELEKIVKSNLPKLAAADGLAYELNKLDKQAQHQLSLANIDAARKGLRKQ